MNIFVARLSSETTGDDLRELFGRFGEVSFAKVVFDRETGASKRYGFVEMPVESEGTEAIDAINESEFQGSTVVAKVSEPREERRPQQRDYRNDNRGGGFRRNDNRGGGGFRRDDNRGGGGYRRDDRRGGGGYRRDDRRDDDRQYRRNDNYRRGGGFDREEY